MRGTVDPYFQFMPGKFNAGAEVAVRHQLFRVEFECGGQPKHQFDQHKHLLAHQPHIFNRFGEISFHTHMNMVIIKKVLGRHDRPVFADIKIKPGPSPRGTGRIVQHNSCKFSHT